MIEWFLGLSGGVMRYWSVRGPIHREGVWKRRRGGEWNGRRREVWSVGCKTKDESGEESGVVRWCMFGWFDDDTFCGEDVDGVKERIRCWLIWVFCH